MSNFALINRLDLKYFHYCVSQTVDLREYVQLPRICFQGSNVDWECLHDTSFAGTGIRRNTLLIYLGHDGLLSMEIKYGALENAPFWSKFEITEDLFTFVYRAYAMQIEATDDQTIQQSLQNIGSKLTFVPTIFHEDNIEDLRDDSCFVHWLAAQRFWTPKEIWTQEKYAKWAK